MKYLLILALALLQMAQAAEPLRVFIRSGDKTHGPGAHDYPAFLKDWTKLLNDRGAKATGGDQFPTAKQLSETDVLILHAEEAGNIEGEDRKNLEAYLKRGGGVVAIHGGTVSRDPDWYKTVIGGSWNFERTKWLEGHMALYFTDRENPITKAVSNFDLDDEIYYDMDMLPDVNILAAAYTPKPKEGSDDGKRVNIFDIQPQIWTYETGNRRAFTCLPGHIYENFSHFSLQTILLRGIAWAGKLDDVDAFVEKDKVEHALRYPVGGPTPPKEALGKFEVHPDFELSLAAAEPLVNKVLNVDWDEKGRMWVVESPEYPNGRRKVNTDTWKDMGSLKPGEYDRDPLDRISILADTTGDGIMDKKHVFADKLELATSFVLHKNGVIVAAAPDIWLLEDTTGDLVADKRTKLYTGLGTGDTHAVINNLRWGLDGWIYATHGYSGGEVKALGAPEKPAVGIGSGVLRFKPDGTEIEMFSSRGGNTWGLCMTSDGQCFWTQPTSGTVLFHTVLPESVLAKGKLAGTNSWKGMITGQKVFPLVKWDQLPYVQIDLVGSYTAAAGCAIYEGGAWPDKWNHSYFVGEPTVNIVSHYFVQPDGITYDTVKEKGREEMEFIRSSDLWFRPVDTRIGPDGALYVVDFYNQAVAHNDTRGPQHGPANAAVRPDRDHYFGRIWRIQHKDAKKVEIPALKKGDVKGLTAALKNPNAHTRMTAVRLLREAGQIVGTENGTQALAEYNQHKDAATPAEREALIAAFAKADDDWTKSALIAAGSEHALEVVLDSLKSPNAEKATDLVSNLLPMVLRGDSSMAAGNMLIEAAKAPAAADSVKSAILDAITATQNVKPPLSATLSDALAKLLANPMTASQTLPLISRWDTGGQMKGIVQKQVDELAKMIGNSAASVAEREAAARALVAVGSESSIKPVFKVLQSTDEPHELQVAIVEIVGNHGFAENLTGLYEGFSPAMRSAAFDEILKRPASALALLNLVDSGDLDPTTIAVGNIARLRSHPDNSVSSRAEALVDKLMPGAKEKSEIIESFLPEVAKPGDVANGEVLFGAACAICHQFGDIGNEVGPDLTGMGAHGAQELLVHIIDPNREVDPSFWQWNITTKQGETLAGIIVSENAGGITLRNQGGDVEIRKDDIEVRENTHRSLMPEGLEGLGAEGLRDLLAYMVASDDSRYQIVDLRDAYTADARRGLFASEEATQDSVFPRKYGNLDVEGVPFFLMDPETSGNGRNLVVLKGGGGDNAAQSYPQKVEISTNVNASRLYMISGIAGWGYPAIQDNRVALKVTLTHASGEVETTELRNREEFADYIGEHNVPGSKLIKDFVHRGQLRLLTVPVSKPGPITKITLESLNNGVTPVVVSITADLSDKSAEIETTEGADTANVVTGALADESPHSTAATGQKFAEPKKNGSLRVLLVGAGSSHHFPRDFVDTDQKILSKIKGANVVGTMNLAEALELMPKADVLVFSGNDDQFGRSEFQEALHAFADAGKGILLVHAATWNHPWEGYNKRFVTGDTGAHGYGEVGVDQVPRANHPILRGVPKHFTIQDESYHFRFYDGVNSTVLLENKPDGNSPDRHAALWIVKDPKAKIVCYTHGHDDKSHANPAYQQIITNAVQWLGAR